MMRSAEQDLLRKGSGCFLLQACPSRRVLPWLCPARLAGYFWFFVRLLRNPDMGHSQGVLAKAKDTPCCLCCQGQSFGRKEFSNWEGGDLARLREPVYVYSRGLNRLRWAGRLEGHVLVAVLPITAFGWALALCPRTHPANGHPRRAHHTKRAGLDIPQRQTLYF